MAVRMSDGLANYVLDSGIGTAFDSTGRINVYSGSQPASANDAASGTLLGTLTLSSDAFAAAASRAIAINSVTSDTSADASATAGYVRFYRTGDTAPGSAAGASDRRLDLDIPDDIVIDNASIVASGVIALSAYSLGL